MSIAIDDEREATQLCDGTKLSTSEDRMRGLEQNMLELARPRLIAIVQDLDTPYFIVVECAAHWFVNFPVRFLALNRLYAYERWCPSCAEIGTYTVCAGGNMTTRTVLKCFGGDFTALGAAAEGHGVSVGGV